MKLVYAGKYNGDEDTLPYDNHKTGAVMFKESKNMTTLSILINVIGITIAIVLICFVVFYGGWNFRDIMIASILNIVLLVLHEYLHAICFQETVYVYNYLSHGIVFVIGTESMSKKRFVFMNLCSNLILGLLPFLIFCIFPEFLMMGYLGAINIGSGTGDYMNAIHALIQMPKGARTYMYKMHSYWYMPK